MGRHGIAVDGEHRPPEQRAKRLGVVPPSIMVARSQDLGSGQAFEPNQVGLKVAVVLSHGEIAGEQHEIPRRDHVAPVSFDVGGMIAPSRGETLAADGSGKRQVQVGDRPDVHSTGIEIACRLADERIRPLLLADCRGAAVARVDDGIIGELEKFGADAAQ